MRRKILSMLLLSTTVFYVSACSSEKSKSGKSSENAVTIEQTTHEKQADHIDYDDQESWEFTSGKMQSPIDIVTSQVEEMTSDSGVMTLNYEKDVTKAENNGHSIQVSNGGSAIINGRSFTLSQFHFHAESEHTVDGKHYPMEVHFVNKAQDGRIAVIGVFFKEGTENKGFEEVLDDVDNDKTDPITDLDDLLPANKSYYHYLGSLTTPPLNENVEWYVMKEPVEVSANQIEQFKKLYSHNNREIQPLNDRVILEHVD